MRSICARRTDLCPAGARSWRADARLLTSRAITASTLMVPSAPPLNNVITCIAERHKKTLNHFWRGFFDLSVQAVPFFSLVVRFSIRPGLFVWSAQVRAATVDRTGRRRSRHDETHHHARYPRAAEPAPGRSHRATERRPDSGQPGLPPGWPIIQHKAILINPLFKRKIIQHLKQFCLQVSHALHRCCRLRCWRAMLL